MKKFYTLLIAFLSFSFCVSSQNFENSLPSFSNDPFQQNLANLKSANEQVYLVDSIIKYLIVDTELEIITKILYTYDERGNNINNQANTRDINTGIYTPSYRNIFVFSNDNKKLHYYQLNWNASTTSWDSIYQHEYFYDEDDLLIKDYNTKYNTDSSKWESFSSYYYKYDSNKISTGMTLKKWNVEKKEWENSYDYIFHYNENGKLAERINNKWDATSLSWQNNSKSENIYDENNFMIKQLVKKWDKTTSTWGNYRQYNYTNGENGLAEHYILKIWNSDKSIYENVNEYNYKYNEYNNLIEFSPRYWDKEKSEWIAKQKSVYFYSLHEKDNTGVVEFKSQIRIYPNPARNELHITNITAPSVVTIHTIDGKLVAQHKVNAGNITLDLNSLKVGLYIININNSSGQQTAKFIKQ